MKYNVIWSPSYRVRIEAGDKVLAKAVSVGFGPGALKLNLPYDKGFKFVISAQPLRGKNVLTLVRTPAYSWDQDGTSYVEKREDGARGSRYMYICDRWAKKLFGLSSVLYVRLPR
jgi:hypothetical protein